MYGRHYRLSLGPAGHPLLQVLWLLVFGVALVGAVLMGALILSFLLGAAAVAAAVLAVRIWWFRRKLRRSVEQRDRFRGSGHDSRGRLIDADYTVVAEREARMRSRR